MTPGLYRLLTRLASPIIPLILRQRLKRGKEDPARLGERRGWPGRTRPPGPLVWCHGASVGEMMSALPLMAALRRRWPELGVLVTTGTVTSAALFTQRVSDPRVIHQFVPVDHPAAVTRFLEFWQPDLGLMIESELWPNLILTAAGRGVPLVLANGHMSERSFAGWAKRPRMIRPLLTAFRAILAQSDVDGARFTALGGDRVAVLGQLKFDAPALGHDDAERGRLAAALGARPRLLALSTHAGEEEMVLDAYRDLMADFPDLITLIVPRHPERGPAVATHARDMGLATARRAAGEKIETRTAVYIADTLGETGLFCRLAPFAFVGGSLVPKGGHNPLEPARLGLAVLIGPDTRNCTEAAGLLRQVGALRDVTDGESLANAARIWLADPASATRAGAVAVTALAAARGAVERTLDRLTPLVKTLLASKGT